MKPITTGSCQAVTITLPKVARTAACKFLSLLPDHWLWELPSSRHFLVKVAGSGALPRQLPGSGLAVRVLAGRVGKYVTFINFSLNIERLALILSSIDV